jgi:multiple sugar transport system ATP-binding protein
VIAGIRPEHLVRGGAIRATVDMVEPIGHESIVYASAGAEKLVTIFDPHDAPRVGETVSLSASRLHLFDAASEMALQSA